MQPDVIPAYWIWVYWCNYFAWSFRGFVVNEFASGRYSTIVDTPSGPVTQGDAILIQYGFVDSDDDPYSFEWAGWGVLFAMLCCILAVFCSVICLSGLRFETGKSLVTDKGELDQSDDDEDVDDEATTNEVEIPFKRVDLTFKGIHYIVKASTSDEKLELLKGIDGVVAAGQMTALMGSSGAGKTSKFLNTEGINIEYVVFYFQIFTTDSNLPPTFSSNGCPCHEKEFWRDSWRSKTQWSSSGGEFVSALDRICRAVRHSVTSAYHQRDVRILGKASLR